MLFDKSTVMNGTLGTWWNELMVDNGVTLGTIKDYDTDNGYVFFVTSSGYMNDLKIMCKRTPTDASVQALITVTPWTSPPGAPQQGSSNLLATIDHRIKNGVIRNGRLYACHGVGSGGVTKVRWYEIDLQGWPDSANDPVLLQEGELELGTGVYSWFPDIHVSEAGNVTVSYNRSAANEFPSTEASWRTVGDPVGTMPNVQRLITSNVPYTADRYGDLQRDGRGSVRARLLLEPRRVQRGAVGDVDRQVDRRHRSRSPRGLHREPDLGR